MKNEYEIRGDVTAIFTNTPRFGRLETIIDTRNLERAKEFRNLWYTVKFRSTFYVMGYLKRVDGKQKFVYLHRWIMDVPKGAIVDHIDHDGLNNTDDNLRIVTNAENMQNRKGPNTNSKSGIRGVMWHKHTQKWVVTVGINGVPKHIGIFENLKVAEQAAIAARANNMPFSMEAVANEAT